MTSDYHSCVCVCGNAEHSRRGTQSDPGVSARTQVDVRRHAHLVRTVCDHCTRLARVLRQMNDSESRVTAVHSTSVIYVARWSECWPHCGQSVSTVDTHPLAALVDLA